MRHIHRFAGTLLDRIFPARRSFQGGADVESGGANQLHRALQPDRAAIYAGRVGNFEVLRVYWRSSQMPRVCVVLDTQTPALSELLRVGSRDRQELSSTPRGGTDIVLAMNEALPVNAGDPAGGARLSTDDRRQIDFMERAGLPDEHRSCSGRCYR